MFWSLFDFQRAFPTLFRRYGGVEECSYLEHVCLFRGYEIVLQRHIIFVVKTTSKHDRIVSTQGCWDFLPDDGLEPVAGQVGMNASDAVAMERDIKAYIIFSGRREDKGVVETS